MSRGKSGHVDVRTRVGEHASSRFRTAPAIGASGTLCEWMPEVLNMGRCWAVSECGRG
jgi:hypothetical protein